MRRQTRIVVGFLDQVLRSGALIVEPHQQIDPVFHVGHEDAVTVLRGVEQLVLLRLIYFLRLGFPIAQGEEPMGFPPALRLIGKLAFVLRRR
jgi:hypothetical protein